MAILSFHIPDHFPEAPFLTTQPQPFNPAHPLASLLPFMVDRDQGGRRLWAWPQFLLHLQQPGSQRGKRSSGACLLGWG